MQRGKVSRAAAMSQLEADTDYYHAPLDCVDAIRVWRELSAVLGSRKMPDAERAFVMRSFAEDAEASGWSLSRLERAAAAWRGRTGERFVPTFGQLMQAANELGVAGGSQHFRELMRTINPPPVQMESKVTYLPPPPPQGMDLAQTEAALAKMESERAANCVQCEGKPDREWGRADEIFYSGLKVRHANLLKEAS